jgi:hypothetical protein
MKMGGTGISFRGQGKKVKAMTLEERNSPGASSLEVLYDGRNKHAAYQPFRTSVQAKYFRIATRHGGRGRRAKRGVSVLTMVVLPRFLFEASLGLSWLDMVNGSKTGRFDLLFLCICSSFLRQEVEVGGRKDSK